MVGPMTDGQPLEGVTVLDFTQIELGPCCTQTLGDFGADVVKVERPDGGDDTRTWGPPFVGDAGAMFLCANASKRSLALALADPDGLAALLRLADAADVFVQSLRPGLAETRGLGYEVLRGRKVWVASAEAAAVRPYSARSPTCWTKARSRWPKLSCRSSIIGPARSSGRRSTGMSRPDRSWPASRSEWSRARSPSPRSSRN